MIALVFFALAQNRNRILDSDKPLTYSEFLRQVSDQNVTKGEISKDQFKGEYRKRPAAAQSDSFVVDIPSTGEAQSHLYQKLDEGRVDYKFVKPFVSDWMLGLLYSVMLPLILIAVIWIMFVRQAQSGGNQALSFGRARAKRLTDNVPK